MVRRAKISTFYLFCLFKFSITSHCTRQSYEFEVSLKQNTSFLGVKQLTKTLREMCIVVLLDGAQHPVLLTLDGFEALIFSMLVDRHSLCTCSQKKLSSGQFLIQLTVWSGSMFKFS